MSSSTARRLRVVAGARTDAATSRASALKRVSGPISRVNATTRAPAGSPRRARSTAASSIRTSVPASRSATAAASSTRAAITRTSGNRSRSIPASASRVDASSSSTAIVGTDASVPDGEASSARGRMPDRRAEDRMTKDISIVHHADRRTDVMMPYAPGIVVRRGQFVFLSGVTAAAVYHSHPHREEEFDLPSTMREQAVLVMENLKKTLEAAGCTFADLVSATRFLTDVAEQDDLNRVWAQYLGGHLPTTTTVEVSRLATHPRCKLEITAIAVADEAR